MEFKNLLIEQIEEILFITINRENKLNALNKAVLSELSEAISHAQHNINIGGIIITGAGEKSFVAGADISEFASFNLEEGRILAKSGQETVFNLIERSSKPVIAAINGFALGGGLELALACHIRIASENARLGLPEVSLGLIPGYGGTQRLTQLVGKGKAFELILTADMISATAALEIGLINHVYPSSTLMEEAKLIMNKILSRSPDAIKSAIIAINASSDSTLNGFDVEIEQFGNCFKTENFHEGVNAFLDKRPAKFRRS
jgi:enoyl-CoA hydratase